MHSINQCSLSRISSLDPGTFCMRSNHLASHAEGLRVDSRLKLHRFILCTRSSGGTAHEGGSATGQFDLPSLTSLSVAACSRLQLGVPHWATSADYCNLLIIDPTFGGSRFSTGRLLAIKDFTFTFIGEWWIGVQWGSSIQYGNCY